MSSCTSSFSTKVPHTFRKNDIFPKKQILGTLSWTKKDSYLGFTAQTSSQTNFVSAMDEDCKLEVNSAYISDGYSKEVEIAVRAVHMACLLCQRVQENLLSESSEHVHSKEDDSPVTIAGMLLIVLDCIVVFSCFGCLGILGLCLRIGFL
uniref:Diphosphonucleoside phosphohydrolase n=1 Tax=Solanum tuberosum TaxID=4113 RepID=M1C1D2_SOLTU